LLGHIYALVVVLRTKLAQVKGTPIARFMQCYGRCAHESRKGRGF